MKKNDLMKILFPLIFLCLLLIGCKKENMGANDSGNQSRRNNVGVFTLTGIPKEYDGKFVFLYGGRRDLIGVEKINSITKDFSTLNVILPKISNGVVNIPLWNMDENNSRYSGNHSFFISIIIYEKSNLSLDNIDDQIFSFWFNGEKGDNEGIVTFVNGSAKRNWTDID
jgi:hypothetical protein